MSPVEHWNPPPSGLGRLFGLTGMVGSEHREELSLPCCPIVTHPGPVSSTLFVLMQVFIFYEILLADSQHDEHPALLGSEATPAQPTTAHYLTNGIRDT
jgi:hypothetical protein